MNPMRCFTVAIISILTLSSPVQAENLQQLRQLLSTKQCPGCDLSNSGLVMSNLAGASLSQANLVNANLSQANLIGADLSGANLTGASLYGANLSGANLSGAILTGTDLREAYLTNANLTGTVLETAYVEGSQGIPHNAGTPELFFNWGLLEMKQRNFTAALEHFDKALTLEPEFAVAYLGRGYVMLRTGKEVEATQNLEVAAALFKKQNNTQGYDTAENLIENIEAIQEARSRNGNSAQVGNLVRGVGMLLLRFLPGLL